MKVNESYPIPSDTPHLFTSIKEVEIEKNGGRIIISKTQIEDKDRGYFAVFVDCEGNRVGLYAEK